MKFEGGCYCSNVGYVSEGEPAFKAHWLDLRLMEKAA
jgi:hypothetical protein